MSSVLKNLTENYLVGVKKSHRDLSNWCQRISQRFISSMLKNLTEIYLVGVKESHWELSHLPLTAEMGMTCCLIWEAEDVGFN